MNRHTLFWGFLLILVGGLFLLSNLGVLQVNAGSLILPVAVIALGVYLLLNVGGRQPGREQVLIPLEGANAARLRLTHGAGRLVVGGGSQAGDLLSGACEGGVSLRTSRSGSRLDVEMSVPEGGFPVMGWSGRTLDWDLRLNPAVPLTLDVRSGASETSLDLSHLKVIDFKLSTGASSTTVQMPANAGFTLARVEAGAASVVIDIPQGTGGRIRSESGLADIQVDPLRFPRHGDQFISPDYEYAENKIDLEIHAGVGSVRVR